MALVFVRLRLRLLQASLARLGIAGSLAVGFAVVLAVGVGGFASVMMAFLRFVDIGERPSASAAALAAIFGLWILGPLMTASAEEGIPLSPFAVLPLSPRRLAVGLLAAGAVGFGSLVTVLTLAGFVVAWSQNGPAAAFATAVAAAFLAMCIAASRLVIAAVSLAARRRRWRDLVTVVAPLAGIGLAVSAQLVSANRVGAHVDARGFLDSADAATRFLPSTLASGAVGAFARGDMLGAVWRVGGIVAVTAVMVAAWAWLLDLLLTRAADRVTREAAWRPLFAGLLRVLPRTRVGAVAAKEARLLWRDPRRRMATFSAFIGASVPMIGFVMRSRTPSVVLVAAVAATVLCAQSTNQFGFDGRSYWLNVAAGDDVRGDIRGRHLALAALATLVFTLAAIALVARSGDASYLLVSLAAACAAGPTALGLATYVSVTFPIAIPDDPVNPLSMGGPGRNVAAVMPSLAVLGAAALVGLPFAVFAFSSTRELVVDSIVLVAGVVVGAIGWTVSTGMATRNAAPRLPELLEAIDPTSQ